MRIVLHILLLIATIICAIWAYSIAGKTRALDSQLSKLKIDIRLEEEALDVLSADWAYLNRPKRLRHLVNLYAAQLQLIPIGEGHFLPIQSVPYPSLERVEAQPVVNTDQIKAALKYIDIVEDESR